MGVTQDVTIVPVDLTTGPMEKRWMLQAPADNWLGRLEEILRRIGATPLTDDDPLLAEEDSYGFETNLNELKDVLLELTTEWSEELPEVEEVLKHLRRSRDWDETSFALVFI